MRGVAAYANAPLWRLIATLVFFGLFSAVLVIWGAAQCWAPVIDEAVAALPTNSIIQGGRLTWPVEESRLLGSNPFLAIEVANGGSQLDGAPADLRIKLGPGAAVVNSIFGSHEFAYSPGWVVELNQQTISPVWGAWRPMFLASLGAAAFAGLLASWGVLGFLNGAVIGMIGAMFNRDAGLGKTWKAGTAAMMPGALLMDFGLGLYVIGKGSLFFLLFIFGAHFVVGWVYVLATPFFLPRRDQEPKNPFNSRRKKSEKARNPFSRGAVDDDEEFEKD